MVDAVTHLEKTIAGEVQPVTHLEHVITEHGGGGGFTPTDAQLAAMNSGITSEDVEQISTNENNISLQQDTTEQGGNGYGIINGKRLYMSDIAPSSGRAGDVWLTDTGAQQYGTVANVATATIEQGTFYSDGSEGYERTRVRTKFDKDVFGRGSYTVSITGANDVSMYVYDTDKVCIPSEGSGGWQPLPYSFNLAGDRYVRFAFRKTNNPNISPSDVSNYTLSFTGWGVESDMTIEYNAPIVSTSKYSKFRNRTTNQDIAVYNGTIVESDTGFIKINGTKINITNGHGNNCNFGTTLHGDYPYLYCPAWNENVNEIYVNQITNSTATLVSTITIADMSTGYLNAVVDEANERIYCFIADDPYVGNITFLVTDMSGNTISTKSLATRIPIIQGMTYYNGNIYLTSGSPNTNDKIYLYVFDTNGDIVSKTSKIQPFDEIEGISFDIDDTFYIATIHTIYK